MNISFPDSMKQYVEDQVNSGCYRSASEYLGELVLADQKRTGKEQLEQRLIQSLNSGEPVDITPDMLQQVRKRLQSQAKGPKSAKI
jgi:antitoxin ParD1/3/4